MANNDFLKNISPEQIMSLESSGKISKDTADKFRQNLNQSLQFNPPHPDANYPSPNYIPPTQYAPTGINFPKEAGINGIADAIATMKPSIDYSTPAPGWMSPNEQASWNVKHQEYLKAKEMESQAPEQSTQQSQAQQITQENFQPSSQAQKIESPSSQSSSSKQSSAPASKSPQMSEEDKAFKMAQDARMEYTESLKKLQAESEELSKKTFDKFWESKTTGQKIIGYLAIAAGAAANYYGKGENQTNLALEQIKKTFDEDITKRTELLKKRGLTAKEILDSQIAYTEAAYKQVDRKMDMYIKGENLQIAKERLALDRQEVMGKLLTNKYQATEFTKKTEIENADVLAKFKPNRDAINSDIAKLNRAIKILETDKLISGPIIGKFKNESISPKQKEVSDAFGNLTSRNLKEILGGQFAQKEGDRLLSYGFDANLPQDVILKRAIELRDAVEGRTKYLNGLDEYAKKTGGKTWDYEPPVDKKKNFINKINER